MKNIIYIILAILLFSILIFFVYQKENIKNKTYTYLETKGCYERQIKNIKIKYSLINKILSYDAWSITVNIYDRYEYVFTYKNKNIILRSLNDEGKLSKDDYQSLMERLENSQLCTKEEDMIGKKSNYKLTDDVLSLKIKEGSLTNTSATLILTNHTEDTYTYGEGFHIEYEEDNVWYEINPINNLDFILIGHTLKPNEVKEIKVDWSIYYGELIPKKYRIIKSANKNDENSSNNFVFTGAEFIIE